MTGDRHPGPEDRLRMESNYDLAQVRKREAEIVASICKVEQPGARGDRNRPK
jgi:hypothetical protein